MFVFGNFLQAIAQILHMVITIYIWIVIISALISWVNPDPYNPVVRFLRGATEPVLYRIRRFMPMVGGIDFSPMVLILLLYFVDMFVIRTLSDVAYSLR
ncbi:MAG: YggT family protein [bacterium]|nr:YggT family protein [bacterium]